MTRKRNRKPSRDDQGLGAGDSIGTDDRVGADNRVGTIIATIVRSILAAPDDESDLEGRVLARLARDGYESDEVREAFRMLGKVMASLRADTVREKGVRFVEVPPRTLTESESLRMSEEAISLFRTWQELRLMTHEETEEILQHVRMSGVGDVETGDLVRIAENVASHGSSLRLYLANSAGPLQ